VGVDFAEKGFTITNITTRAMMHRHNTAVRPMPRRSSQCYAWWIFGLVEDKVMVHESYSWMISLFDGCQ